jgi:hypothetical protein
MLRRDCKLLRSSLHDFLLCLLSFYVKAFCPTNFLSKLSVRVSFSELGAEFPTHNNCSLCSTLFKLIYLHRRWKNRPEISPFKSHAILS